MPRSRQGTSLASVVPMRLRRGFSLVEVMVVVIIIGITSAVAIPSYSELLTDRRVQDDASQISSLLREARARAMARGSGVLVAFTGGGGGGGAFAVYESVTTMPGMLPGVNRVPLGTCRSPSRWAPLANTNANIWLLTSADFTGTRDVHAGLRTVYRDQGGVDLTTVYLCFTPTGRVYQSATPNFDGAQPLAASHQFVLSRTSVNLARRVLVTSAGTFRVRSTPLNTGVL